MVNFREAWDAQAATSDAARLAVWSEPADTWDHGVEVCLDEIEAVLGIAGRPRSVIAELGCGVGRLAIPLARRYPSALVCGVDVSPLMLDHARVAAAVASVPNVVWTECDGSSLPSMRFDLAYSVLVFQHLPDDVAAGYVAQLASCLWSGGRVVVQFVDRGDVGPLNYPRPVDTVAGWMRDAGLEPSPPWSAVFEEWVWMTGTKQ